MQIAPLAGQMVRDIRVTAAQAAHPTRQPPARPMTYTRQPTAHTAGQAARSEVSAIPALEEAATQKPAELVFAANPTASENPPPAARPTQRPKQASEAERLPEWARELMEQSGITDTAQQSAVFNGAASRQMNWTAPGAMPAQHQGKPAAEPAELSFKEPRESEQPLYRQQISDAELRRTADKVYRMIEERLRRELRRSGR